MTRLIDADELKKAYFNAINETSIGEVSIIALIDNAPTVEYTFEEAFQKTVCEQRLYCPQRPQSEWIIVKSPLSTETIVKCPYCKDEFIGNGVEDYNFCPICGAQMKRGGET